MRLCVTCGVVLDAFYPYSECVRCYDKRADAEQYLADAACSDTHSSDVDPGAER